MQLPTPAIGCGQQSQEAALRKPGALLLQAVAPCRTQKEVRIMHLLCHWKINYRLAAKIPGPFSY